MTLLRHEPDCTLGDCSPELTGVSALDNSVYRQLRTVPIVWAVSYSGVGASRNIQFLENAIREFKLDLSIRVFISNRTEAVLVTLVSIESVKEPHVAEWRDTFNEISLEAAKDRFERFPVWPYDGRTREQGWADSV